MSDQILVWVDVETSGLNRQRDMILEIAASIATFNDPFNATPIYHAVVQEKFGENILSKLDPIVREMHTKSGLIEACRKSTTGYAQMFLDFRDALPLNAILAGSSVHFDRDFLVAADPTLMGRFSHRLYDVSAVKLFCRSLGMPPIPKAEVHRAEADVLESIAHAKECASWLVECT